MAEDPNIKAREEGTSRKIPKGMPVLRSCDALGLELVEPVRSKRPGDLGGVQAIGGTIKNGIVMSGMCKLAMARCIDFPIKATVGFWKESMINSCPI